MTSEQQRKILESAAKACGIRGTVMGSVDLLYEKCGIAIYWNPLTYSSDCAEMCVELGIDTTWFKTHVACEVIDDSDKHLWAIGELKDHDNSRLKAWMYAATMVAAKIGGYE